MLSKLLAIHLKIPVNFFHSANQNASIEDKICIKKWNEKDTRTHTKLSWINNVYILPNFIQKQSLERN